MTYDAGELKCSEPGCNKTIKNHRWGRTKAEGWFIQQDDTAWCPDHHPKWVKGWRARREKKRL